MRVAELSVVSITEQLGGERLASGRRQRDCLVEKDEVFEGAPELGVLAEDVLHDVTRHAVEAQHDDVLFVRQRQKAAKIRRSCLETRRKLIQTWNRRNKRERHEQCEKQEGQGREPVRNNQPDQRDGESQRNDQVHPVQSEICGLDEFSPLHNREDKHGNRGPEKDKKDERTGQGLSLNGGEHAVNERTKHAEDGGDQQREGTESAEPEVAEFLGTNANEVHRRE